MSMGDGIDEGIKVERRQVRVLCLDVDHIGGVVPRTQKYTLKDTQILKQGVKCNTTL